MKYLTEQIRAYAQQLPEGTPITARSLLHLGSRATVHQSLSRLARREQLMRIGHGLYVLPVKSRFGLRPPTVERLIKRLSSERGETTVPSGAASANALGLTTQVPTHLIYLTSGPSRKLQLGKQHVELRHAPSWQLTLADRPAGAAVRALAWLGPQKAASAMHKLANTLPEEEKDALIRAQPRFPGWLAQSIARHIGNG